MSRSLRLATLCFLVISFAVAVIAKKKEEPLATLNFLVLRDENGKPVKNAAVVMHPVDEDGNQEAGGLELKTDPEGKTSYDGVPYGKLRIQVLANGFQTYGEDYNIDQATQMITIKLKRPTKQFSIYTPRSKQGSNPPAQENPSPDNQNKPQN